MIDAMLPLFEAYPILRKGLPWTPLCTLPTPIEPLSGLADAPGGPALYIKRDDLTGEAHGGNKVRKLEFLLGKALQEKRREVLTFGYAGSNHAAATAYFAHRLGMRCISMLLPQARSPVVRQNILLGCANGAELHLRPTAGRLGMATVWQMVRHTAMHGRRPMVIPAGGSSPLGCVGFVNAAFELRSQIDEGLLPEPDWIYLAMGSMGTAAGLLVGLRASGLRTRIAAVQVTEPRFANPERFKKLVGDVSDLLRSKAPEFPAYRVTADDVAMRTDFFGPGYGIYTAEAGEAAEAMQSQAGIPLDQTYSARAFAAVQADQRAGKLAGKTAVFWNTFNSRPTPVGALPATADIPKPLRAYVMVEPDQAER